MDGIEVENNEIVVERDEQENKNKEKKETCFSMPTKDKCKCMYITVQVFFATCIFLCLGGWISGYNGLKPVMIEKKMWYNFCDGKSELSGTNDTITRRVGIKTEDSCPTQIVYLDLLFFLAASILNLFGCCITRAFHCSHKYCGVRVIFFVSVLCEVVLLILLGTWIQWRVFDIHPVFWLAYVWYILGGVFGVFLLFTFFQYSLAIPKGVGMYCTQLLQGMIFALFTAAWDLSGFVLPFLQVFILYLDVDVFITFLVFALVIGGLSLLFTFCVSTENYCCCFDKTIMDAVAKVKDTQGILSTQKDYDPVSSEVDGEDQEQPKEEEEEGKEEIPIGINNEDEKKKKKKKSICGVLETCICCLPRSLKKSLREKYHGKFLLTFFGYFKNDRTRKTFTIFPCIKIDPSRLENVYFNTHQVVSISFSRFFAPQEMFDLLFKKTRDWKSLESLYLDLKSVPSNFSEWFSKDTFFPRLKRFRLDTSSFASLQNMLNPGLSRWVNAFQFWENVHHLCISFGAPTFLPLFENKKFGKFLRSLEATNILFFKDGVTKTKRIHLPNLERLLLDPLSTKEYAGFPLEYFTNETKKKLRNIDICVTDSTFRNFKTFLMQCPGLREISIEDKTENTICDIDFLFKRPLKRISIKSTSRTTWKKWEEPNNKNFLQNIQKISFSGETNSPEPLHFEKNFISNEFPKLQELSLLHVNLNDALPPVFSPEVLSKIELHRVRGISDRFFRVQNFTNLRSLHINFVQHTYLGNEYGIITGEYWNPMPNLRHLNLEDVQTFTDWIFQNLEMPKLRDLEIWGSLLVKGQAWKKCNTQNLELVSFEFEDSFVPDPGTFCSKLFVEEDRFLRLDKMYLWGMKLPKSSWTDWNVRMRKLHVESCNCPDEFFVGEWVKGLEVLEIKEINVRGVGWAFMEKLRRLIVAECGEFDDLEFSKNRPVPKTCEIEIIKNWFDLE